MDETTQGRVSRATTDVSEEMFVPSLFIPWAAPVRTDAVAPPGQSVRDASALAHAAPDRNQGMPAAVSRSGLKSFGRFAALRAMWRALRGCLLWRSGVARDS